MRKFKQLFAIAFTALSFAASAQQEPSTLTDGYISDELFIYMHSGAGNNYRIVGSINAGTQVKLTGEQRNGYTEIIDDKERTAWVEDKFVSEKPGLRFVVAELNGQLAENSDIESTLKSQLDEQQVRLTDAENKNVELTNQITALESQLSTTQAKLSSQDLDIKKEWFFNGAIVMGIGLILGLLLPRLASRRRSSMDSWK
ncbi:MAG: TIGR04211 family SH3 domain-containing protein [Thalassotalea sp.]|nr:TIGR04211 family SH3 domain-containing protein [Thalassotalea sp.]